MSAPTTDPIPAGLPAGLRAYKRTPVFDQDLLPAGLRRQHSTKAGVWAVIHVLEGRLRYRVLAPFNEEVLTHGRPGLVLPEQRHEVEPLGPVRFFVAFHATVDAPDEPHVAPPI